MGNGGRPQLNVPTYINLEPGPYWLDTGQAQTTSRASLVELVESVEFEAAISVIAFRLTKKFSTCAEENIDMTPHPPPSEFFGFRSAAVLRSGTTSSKVSTRGKEVFRRAV